MTLAPGLRRRCLQMKLATLYVMSVGEGSYVGVCIVSVNVCVNVCVNVSVDVSVDVGVKKKAICGGM